MILDQDKTLEAYDKIRTALEENIIEGSDASDVIISAAQLLAGSNDLARGRIKKLEGVIGVLGEGIKELSTRNELLGQKIKELETDMDNIYIRLKEI